MAAPDIDASAFQQLASDIAKAGGRFTVYESSRDEALKASHQVHAAPRLGDTNPTVNIIEGYDCIDATSVDTGLIGHSYIGDSSSILTDVKDVFQGKGIAERLHLSRMDRGGKAYWEFRR